ncbi:DNA replication protein psf1 [Podochytrium sp. JEL0797]|nr:DNA replication protein psf1 [Podochytrium sp. JEL0797]
MSNTSCFGDEALKLIREAKRSNDSGMFYAYNDGVVRNVKLELKHLYESIKALMAQREDVFGRINLIRDEHPEAAMDLDEEDYDGEGSTLRGTALSQTQVQLKQLSQVSTGFTVAAQMHHQAMHRNKRLLLVYHRSRMDAIKDMVWDIGGGAAASLAEEGGIRIDNDNDMDEDQPNHQQQPTGLPPAIIRAMSPNELEFLSNYRQLLEEYRGSMLDVDLSAPLIPPKDLFVDVRVVKELGEIVTESGAVLKLMKGEQHYVRRSDVDKFITLGYLVQV